MEEEEGENEVVEEKKRDEDLVRELSTIQVVPVKKKRKKSRQNGEVLTGMSTTLHAVAPMFVVIATRGQLLWMRC